MLMLFSKCTRLLSRPYVVAFHATLFAFHSEQLFSAKRRSRWSAAQRRQRRHSHVRLCSPNTHQHLRLLLSARVYRLVGRQLDITGLWDSADPETAQRSASSHAGGWSEVHGEKQSGKVSPRSAR